MVTAGPTCGRGALVSIEGLSGVGKTYLTNLLASRLASGLPPRVLEQSSTTIDRDASLGRVILRALVDAAGGDHFLRGGYPGAETLALLAMKMHDYELSLPNLAAGQLVIEGRSIHSTAVYQSLICHPDDDDLAREQALNLLTLAAEWRPLPDLTILIVDDVEAALSRAEQRDGKNYTDEQRLVHHRAAELFRYLADADPTRVVILDRQAFPTDQLLVRMQQLIESLLPGCLVEPWRSKGECATCCRLISAATSY